MKKRVFMEILQTFTQVGKNGRKEVSRLKNTVYGICQSSWAFWKHLIKILEACGLKQSKFDPCLFNGEHMIYIHYVDDLLFLSDKCKTKAMAIQLQELGLDLYQETDAEVF